MSDEREALIREAAERAYGHGGYHANAAATEDAKRAYAHGARWAQSAAHDARIRREALDEVFSAVVAMPSTHGSWRHAQCVSRDAVERIVANLRDGGGGEKR